MLGAGRARAAAFVITKPAVGAASASVSSLVRHSSSFVATNGSVSHARRQQFQSMILPSIQYRLQSTTITKNSDRAASSSSSALGMGFDLSELYDDEEGDLDAEVAAMPSGPYKKKKKKKSPPKKKKKAEGEDDNWEVPSTIEIPEDRIDMSFARSGGAGGQNVNKVNTKVELRFVVDDADWIPEEVRDRIKTQQVNRINNNGELTLQASDNRTQSANRRSAFIKLQKIVMEAYPRPKVRKMRKGISKKAKERNLDEKKRRSQVKANRRAVRLDD